MIRLTLFFLLTLNCIFLYSQKKDSTYRRGLMLSLASGVASTHFSFPGKTQSGNGLALNWKIGYALNSRLALLINGAVSIYDYNLSGRPRKRDFGGIFPSLQYHPKKKWWLLGGIGIGTDAPVFFDLKPETKEETEYYSGYGVLTALGYEVYKRKNFTIDLQARFNFSDVNLPVGNAKGFNTGLLIGINFY